MKIMSADFVKSATTPEQCPDEGLPEVAFAGRSNVGKSSLINALLNRGKLARTSSNPGHTRALNFFRVNSRCMFADLPGFGYAKVSRKERGSWRKMIESYLSSREELCAVVLIMDIRRAPGNEERELIGALTGIGIPILLVATKADKLGKTRRVRPVRELAAALGIPPEAVIIFSSTSGLGKEELWKKLVEMMDSR